MKVRPAPNKSGNITFHYNVNRSLAEVERLIVVGRQKKLRRLPHVFSKVLELPFGSDADVDVHEEASEFVFVVTVENFGEGVKAHAIQIHPGITKVVIRCGGSGGDETDDLELDRLRFRLPSYTIPDLAVARYDKGVLVVIIPKVGGSLDISGDDDDCNGNGLDDVMAAGLEVSSLLVKNPIFFLPQIFFF